MEVTGLHAVSLQPAAGSQGELTGLMLIRAYFEAKGEGDQRRNVVIPDTATLYVVPLPVTVAVVAPAVPLSVTSPVVKPVTASLNTTVKLIGPVLAGSVWPVA